MRPGAREEGWQDGGIAGSGPALGLQHVTLGYRGVPAVVDVNGRFPAGSLTAIVGPNGGGKTTLLKGLLGLLRPQRGRIVCAEPHSAIAHLAQRSEVDPTFPITVADFVAIGLWSVTGSLQGVTRPQALKVASALRDVGLDGAGGRWVSELSGGQFQRMRFARLLVQDAPVVLLDEPFAGVDEGTVEALLRLVVAWHGRGRTVIAVLHDRERVRRHFPLTLALDRRVLGWGETATTLAALAGPGQIDVR